MMHSLPPPHDPEIEKLAALYTLRILLVVFALALTGFAIFA